VNRVNFTACSGTAASAISVTGSASLTALDLVITDSLDEGMLC
jgi:hypothetical protein